jgi:hypothetical protein
LSVAKPIALLYLFEVTRWVSLRSTHPTDYRLPRTATRLTGKSPSNADFGLSSPEIKYILICRSANRLYMSPRSTPFEGRFMIVTNAGGMRWTRQRQARHVMAGRFP